MKLKTKKTLALIGIIFLVLIMFIAVGYITYNIFKNVSDNGGNITEAISYPHMNYYRVVLIVIFCVIWVVIFTKLNEIYESKEGNEAEN